MRERTGGNVIHPRVCIFAHIEQRDAAAGFRFEAVANHGYGFRQDGKFEIVEHNTRNAADIHHFFHFHQIAHFDGNAELKSFFLLVFVCAIDGFADTARSIDVVVLDHHPVVQAPAVVFAAADFDGPFFQKTDQGRCFTCIEHFHGQIAHFECEAAAQGSDAAHALHRIEYQAFGLENRPGISFHFESDFTIKNIGAVGFVDGDTGSGIDVFKNQLRQFNAGQYAVIFYFEHRPAAAVGRNGGQGSMVAVADIFI